MPTSDSAVKPEPKSQRTPILDLDRVSKSYGEKVAVDGVSLKVHAREIVGLIGPNGAGKTTTLRIVLDLARDWTGTVKLFGTDYKTDALSIKKRIGFVPEVVELPGKLRVAEYMRYVAALHDLPGEQATSAWREFASKFRFEVDPRALIETLSKGNRQKLAIVSSLLHRPVLWVLDEPLAGLDPDGMRGLSELVTDYRASGNTVWISSHALDFVEKVCTRVHVMAGGRIVAEKTLDDGERSPTVSASIAALYERATSSKR